MQTKTQAPILTPEQVTKRERAAAALAIGYAFGRTTLVGFGRGVHEAPWLDEDDIARLEAQAGELVNAARDRAAAMPEAA